MSSKERLSGTKKIEVSGGNYEVNTNQDFFVFNSTVDVASFNTASVVAYGGMAIGKDLIVGGSIVGSGSFSVSNLIDISQVDGDCDLTINSGSGPGCDIFLNAQQNIDLTSGNDLNINCDDIWAYVGDDFIVRATGDFDVRAVGESRLYGNHIILAPTNQTKHVGDDKYIYFYNDGINNIRFGLGYDSSKTVVDLKLFENPMGIVIDNSASTDSGEIKLRDLIEKETFIEAYSFNTLSSNPIFLNRGYELGQTGAVGNTFFQVGLSKFLPHNCLVTKVKVYFWISNDGAGSFSNMDIELNVKRSDLSGSSVDHNSFGSSATIGSSNSTNDIITHEISGSINVEKRDPRSVMIELSVNEATIGGAERVVFSGVKVTYETRNPTCFGATDNYNNY